MAFFKGMIRKLHRSCHHHYSNDCGHLDAKDRRNAAPRKMIAAMVLDPLKLQTSQSQVEHVAAGLKLKLHQFWVYPFRDVWPAAQPSLPDGPDSSSNTDDEMEQKSEQDRTVRRRRRLKRTRRSDPIPPAVIDDDGDAKNFIGRVVSCPSWCIGIAWSRQRYGSTAASKKARIHGVLSESTKADNHRCIFYNDSFPDIDLTLRQVQKWVVDVDNEAGVKPFG